MSEADKHAIEGKIAELISQHTVREALAYLADALPGGAVIYLVGGAIRNLTIEFFHHRRLSTDDIDLFVGGVAEDIHLAEIFPEERFVSTDLGGVRWKPAGSAYDIDICLLKDFIIIKKYRLDPRLENLLDSLDFTMNTVAFDIRSRRLHESNALADIQKQVMVFNTLRLYTKTTIAYRTLVLRHKTGFTLSQDVFDFVKKAIDLDTLMAVKQILNTRFGKNRMQAILDDYDGICSFGSFDDYRRHAAETMAGEA
jgi:tRNA nucleotidyltransferase/poly(A) polymerase